MQDFFYDKPVEHDEAQRQQLREDPVYVGLLNVQLMAIERDIAETRHWIEWRGSDGKTDVETDRRYLQHLLQRKAWYDEQLA